MDANSVVDNFLLPLRIMLSRSEKKIPDSTILTVLKTTKPVFDYVDASATVCAPRKFLEFIGTVLIAVTQKSDISRDGSAVCRYCDDVLDQYFKFALASLHFASRRDDQYLLDCFASDADVGLWAQFVFISKLIAEDETKSVDLRCAALDVLTSFCNLLKHRTVNQNTTTLERSALNNIGIANGSASTITSRKFKERALDVATSIFPGLTSSFMRVLTRSELTNGRILELCLRANIALNSAVLSDTDYDEEAIENELSGNAAAASSRVQTKSRTRNRSWFLNLRSRLRAYMTRLSSTTFLVFNERVAVRSALLDFCIALLDESAQTLTETCIEELFTMLLTFIQDDCELVSERAHRSLSAICIGKRSIKLSLENATSNATPIRVGVELGDILNRTLFTRLDERVLRLVRVLRTEPSDDAKLRELRIATGLITVLNSSGKANVYLSNDRRASQLAAVFRELCLIDYSESARLTDATPLVSGDPDQAPRSTRLLRFRLLTDARLVRQFDALIGAVCSTASGASFALSSFTIDSDRLLEVSSSGAGSLCAEQLHLLARALCHVHTSGVLQAADEIDAGWRAVETQIDESFSRLVDVATRVSSLAFGRSPRNAVIASTYLDALASAHGFFPRDSYLLRTLSTFLQLSHTDNVIVSSSARAAILRLSAMDPVPQKSAADFETIVERQVVNRNADLLLHSVTVQLSMPDTFCDACFVLTTVLQHADCASTLGVVGDLLARLFAFLDSNYELSIDEEKDASCFNSFDDQLAHPLRSCLRVLTAFCQSCARFESQHGVVDDNGAATKPDRASLAQITAELHKTHEEAQFAFGFCRNIAEKVTESIQKVALADNDAPEEVDESAEPKKKPVSAHIRITVEILSRCAALVVATRSLRARVWLLETIRWCFRALRCYEDELLPQTHRLWPTLSSCMLQLRSAARQSDASSLLGNPIESNFSLERTRKLRISQDNNNEQVDKVELLIAQHAFDTLGVLLEATADFVSGRIDKVLNEALEFLRSTMRDDAERPRRRLQGAGAVAEEGYYRVTREFKLRRCLISVLSAIYVNLKLKYPLRNAIVSLLMAHVFSESTPNELREAATDTCVAIAGVDKALVLFRIAEETIRHEEVSSRSLLAVLSNASLPQAQRIIAAALGRSIA